MRSPLFLLALPFLLIACRDANTRRVDPPPVIPDPKCGDGNIDMGEDCDGSNMGTGTCQSLGFDTGQLVCADCKYSTTLCTKRCGNGVLDLGEACDKDLGLEPCATWGYVECTQDCLEDSRHCVSQPFEAAPSLELTKGGAAVIGDLSPKGPGDLVMAVPSFSRVEAFPWVMNQGFDGTSSRKLSFQRVPVQTEVCDVDGDSNADVATVNEDGTFDHYVFTGASFALQAVDAGCAGATFIGRGRFGRGQSIDVAAQGCGALHVIGAGTEQRFDTPDASAVTVADVSGDGVLDLLWVDGARRLEVLTAPGFSRDGGVTLPVQPSAIASADLDGDGDADLAVLAGADVKLLENTGAGFAERATFTAGAATNLQAADLDLDGRPDVAWAAGDELVVRRNRSGWLFSEFRASLGMGARKSLAVGDVDGDGDPDVASTVSLGGDATRTNVVRNRVR